MLAKPILFTIVLLFAVSLIHSVYAQSKISAEMERNILTRKVLSLDNSLTPSIVATLTGLSLTGASFLVALSRSDNVDSAAAHIGLARKFFIKAFFMFLVCTLALFAFDFIQILSDIGPVLITIIDVIVTFAFFGAGVLYLAKAARQLYITYGR